MEREFGTVHRAGEGVVHFARIESIEDEASKQGEQWRTDGRDTIL